MATRKVIERVSARVFCHLEQGGNPVTIFSSLSGGALSPSTQQRLAKDCQWESVMVSQDSTNKLPTLSFYMPSGEQVSFCAHAAMGAALELCLQQDENSEELQDEISFQVAALEDNDESKSKSKSKPTEYHTTIYDADIVALNMSGVPYQQTSISQPPVLYRMLRDYLRVEPNDLTGLAENSTTSSNSICCHASIARPKTLVPVQSCDVLHNQVIAPKSSVSKGFELSCKALDDSTGMYVYAKSETEDGAWECRQFPRSSGYPEDPATGIAAAALACHLYHHQDMDLPTYKMYQGTAMGKPSLIVVDELSMKQVDHDVLQATFRLLGRVEIDERESMEITEDA